MVTGTVGSNLDLFEAVAENSGRMFSGTLLDEEDEEQDDDDDSCF